MTEITWSSPGEPPVADAVVERAVAAALAHGGRRDLELAVVFVGDEALADLHARHLDDSSPTDVMAFDLGEEGAGPAGEVYVSAERAHRVAERRGVEVAREVCLYVVHGVLHLCGYDDHEAGDRERMRAAESEVLAALGFTPDDGAHELGAD